MKADPIAIGRGRSRKTTSENIRKDLSFNDVNIDMTYDRHYMIHLVNPSNQDKV